MCPPPSPHCHLPVHHEIVGGAFSLTGMTRDWVMSWRGPDIRRRKWKRTRKQSSISSTTVSTLAPMKNPICPPMVPAQKDVRDQQCFCSSVSNKRGSKITAIAFYQNVLINVSHYILATTTTTITTTTIIIGIIIIIISIIIIIVIVIVIIVSVYVTY